MVTLLEKAVAEIEKLPDDVQEAIAARLLADLADDKAWAGRFAQTTEAQWNRLAALARRDIEAEGTEPLEHAFQPGKPGT